jgi:hypothetical protein
MINMFKCKFYTSSVNIIISNNIKNKHYLNLNTKKEILDLI